MSKNKEYATHEEMELMTAKAAGLLAQKGVMMEALEMAYHELRVRNGYRRGDACYDELARIIISFSEEKPAWCHNPDDGLVPSHSATPNDWETDQDNQWK